MSVFCFEPDGGDDLVDVAGVGIDAREVGELLANGHVAALARRLQHDAQARLPGEAAPAGVDPEHAHLAGGAVAVSLEDLDRRALARPVRAEQGEGLAAEDVEAHAVEGRELAVGLAQVANAHRDVGLCHVSTVAARAGRRQWCAGWFSRPPVGGCGPRGATA
jgi:hypothetical protein